MTNKGSVLVFALWCLVLFAMLAASLSMRAQMRTEIMRMEKDTVHQEVAFLSGISAARYAILSDDSPAIDSKYDKWFGDIELEDDLYSSENLSLSITDESSKLNINKASKDQLKILIEAICDQQRDVHIDADDLSEKIIKWRSIDSEKYSDIDEVEADDPSFDSLYELYLADDELERETFDVLRQYLSVYDAGEPLLQINPNTASYPVLRAVLMSLAGSESAREDFLGAIVRFREKEFSDMDTGELPYFIKDDLVVESLLRKLDLNGDVMNVSIAVQFLRFLTLDSSVFSVKMHFLRNSGSMSHVDMVLGPAVNKVKRIGADQNLSVLEWSEG